MKVLNIATGNESDMDTLVELNRLKRLEEKGIFTTSDQEIGEGLLSRQQQGIAAYFLKWDNKVIGYAVIDTAQKPYSLKFFYASRNFRSSGTKSINFSKLAEMLEADVLEVETHANNTSNGFLRDTFGARKELYAQVIAK